MSVDYAAIKPYLNKITSPGPLQSRPLLQTGERGFP